MSPRLRFDKTEVFNILCKSFDLEEFRELCSVHLDVKYDDLKGEGLRAKSRELVEMYVRNGKLLRLVEAIQAARPDLPLIPLNEDQHRDGQRTKQVFTLFISAPQPARLSSLLKQIPVFSKLLEPSSNAVGRTLPTVAGDGGGNAPDKLILTTHDDGISIATFEDADALLRQAVAVASAMKKRGEAAPRMGLYSDTVSVSPTSSSDEVPAEAVNLARRIMKLGDADHILASLQVAEYFKQSPEFGHLFAPLGKYQVRPHVRIEVFNVTAADVFGNPARPKRKEQEQVLKKLYIPEQIRCSGGKPIRLTFAENLLFVRVVFKYENPAITISCPGQDGGDECSFDLDFADTHESHKQEFEIGVRGSIKERSQEFVRIYCYDEADELLSPPVDGWITLEPRMTPPKFYDVVHVVLWLREGFTCLRRYQQILVVILLAAAALLLIRYLWSDQIDHWNDDFLLTDDGSSWIQSDKWDIRGITVQPQPGNGDASIKDGALLISGDGIAVHNPAESSPFYDFDMQFTFRFVRGNTARWILRADPDAGRWYEFAFVKDNNNRLSVQGYLRSPDGSLTLLNSSGSPVAIGGCCVEDDEFRVTAQVKDYEFKYCVELQNPKAPRTREASFGVPTFMGLITDKRRSFFHSYRYGNLGLRSKLDSDVLFYFWTIAPLNSSPFCTND